MKFSLVRPCPHCPFRIDIDGYLRPGRAIEIAQSLASGSMFPCHETTEWDEEDEEMFASKDSIQCAGALILMEKVETPNQMARMAERFGFYDPAKLDMQAPVASSYFEFVRHHSDDEDDDQPCCSVVDGGCLAPAGLLMNGVAVPVEPEGEVFICKGCGEWVCEACAEGEFCPTCAEYEENQ